MRGTTKYKTQKQKDDFYNSLFGFYSIDRIFFEEQLNDLTEIEKEEFIECIENDEELKKAVKNLLKK